MNYCYPRGWGSDDFDRSNKYLKKYLKYMIARTDYRIKAQSKRHNIEAKKKVDGEQIEVDLEVKADDSKKVTMSKHFIIEGSRSRIEVWGKK
jgi:hypothetical protein